MNLIAKNHHLSLFCHISDIPTLSMTKRCYAQTNSFSKLTRMVSQWKRARRSSNHTTNSFGQNLPSFPSKKLWSLPTQYPLSTCGFYKALYFLSDVSGNPHAWKPALDKLCKVSWRILLSSCIVLSNYELQPMSCSHESRKRWSPKRVARIPAYL